MSGSPKVGKSFHSFNTDGTLHWEGQIMKDLGDGRFVVILRDWLTARLDEEKEVPATEMTDWELFDSDLESRRAFNRLLDEGRAEGIRQSEDA